MYVPWSGARPRASYLSGLAGSRAARNRMRWQSGSRRCLHGAQLPAVQVWANPLSLWKASADRSASLPRSRAQAADYDAQVNYLRSVVAENPSAVTLNNLGSLYFALPDRHAFAHFEKAAALDPITEHHTQPGTGPPALGASRDAEGLLRRAVTLLPYSVIARINLARLPRHRERRGARRELDEFNV